MRRSRIDLAVKSVLGRGEDERVDVKWIHPIDTPHISLDSGWIVLTDNN